MKQKKELLSEQEMKRITGGYVFPITEFHGNCPLCGEEIYMNAYTYYVVCPNCGNVITVKEKED